MYGEIQARYEQANLKIGTAKTELIGQVTALGKALQAKKQRTGEVIKLDLMVDTGAFIEALDDANALVEKHNSKSRDFKASQQNSVRAIKVHYLSTIHAAVIERNAETRKVITEIFEMMEAIAPEHFAILDKATPL